MVVLLATCKFIKVFLFFAIFVFYGQLLVGVFQIVALEPSPKWRGQGEVIKKRQFEMYPFWLCLPYKHTTIFMVFFRGLPALIAGVQ
jgi:hypothetical protein